MLTRRGSILIMTLILLVGIGAFLHSPPSLLDTVTGATPHTKKAAQQTALPEGKYVLGVNSSTAGNGGSSAGKAGSASKDHGRNTGAVLRRLRGQKIRLYVSETDYGGIRYAAALCRSLKKKDGLDVQVKQYSQVMLRSRIVSGRYVMFLAPADVLPERFRTGGAAVSAEDPLEDSPGETDEADAVHLFRLRGRDMQKVIGTVSKEAADAES